MTHIPEAELRMRQASEYVLDRMSRTTPVDQWWDSRYRWLTTLKPHPKAQAAKDVLMRWLQGYGLDPRDGGNAPSLIVCPPFGSLWVKLSMATEPGSFSFQQLKEGPHTAFALLGLTPHQAYLWIVPADIAWYHSAAQHAEESRVIRFNCNPAEHPAWLTTYGGTTLHAGEMIGRRLRRGE